MAQKLIMTDGANTKGINPWDTGSYPEAWTWFSNAPRNVQSEYYAKVSALYAAMNLPADTLGSIPATLNKENGEEFDNTKNWKNKVGFLPNPSEILRLAVLSYSVSNTIYQLRTTDALGFKQKGLYHAVPTTFTPVVNSTQNDVQYIERRVGTTIERYDYPFDKRLVRMWRLDHTTELLPSPNTMAQAALSSAEIIYYADFWIGNFFKRGGIKPTLIAMKGLIDSDTRNNQEKSWSNWLRGVGKQFGSIARIFNAESIDPKVIGAGVDDMKDNNIYRQAIENISIAWRMPLSILLSNSANRATATEEKATWINNTIMPLAKWIEYEWNEQIFRPMGLYWEFRPESMEEQQEDEAGKSTAYATYINAGMKPSIAAQMLGLELPEGVEYIDLDESIAPKEEPKQPKEDEPIAESEESEDEPEPTKWIPTLDELEELRVWREVAVRRFKKGESLDFEYQPHHGGLPNEVTNHIKDLLVFIQDSEEYKEGRVNLDVIKTAFSISGYQPSKMLFAPEVKANEDIIKLADSINRLAESMTHKESDK